MNPKLQTSLKVRDDVTLLRLSGIIDEDSGLADLVAKIAPGTIVIDVGGVRRINSCGVRDWVDWLGELEARRVEIVLVECSPAIVAQVNMIDAFLRGGVVRSVRAPFVCPVCDKERSIVVDVRALGPAPQPPACRCEACDVAMEFDEVAESFFAFVSNQRPLPPSDRLDGVLASMA